MNMYEMIKSLPSQIQTQYDSASNIDMQCLAEVNHIVVSGMGGSAISGDIALNMFKDYLSVPITVLRDYKLPKWVNDK